MFVRHYNFDDDSDIHQKMRSVNTAKKVKRSDRQNRFWTSEWGQKIAAARLAEKRKKETASDRITRLRAESLIASATPDGMLSEPKFPPSAYQLFDREEMPKAV